MNYTTVGVNILKWIEHAQIVRKISLYLFPLKSVNLVSVDKHVLVGELLSWIERQAAVNVNEGF